MKVELVEQAQAGLPEDDRHPYRSGPWQPNMREFNAFDLEVDDVDIAVLGLAFKPGTDDMRESPAIPIVNALREKGARIKAYDPVATTEARKIFGDDRIEYCDDLAATIAGAQVVVLLTRWDEFRGLPELLERGAPGAVLVDGRRMIDKTSVARYEGIGIQL